METRVSGRGVPPKPGWVGDEHAHVVGGGEQLGEPGHRRRTRPAVQEQERLPGPVFGDGHVDRADSVDGHGAGCGGTHENSLSSFLVSRGLVGRSAG
jgi:hypothetical protein